MYPIETATKTTTISSDTVRDLHSPRICIIGQPPVVSRWFSVTAVRPVRSAGQVLTNEREAGWRRGRAIKTETRPAHFGAETTQTFSLWIELIGGTRVASVKRVALHSLPCQSNCILSRVYRKCGEITCELMGHFLFTPAQLRALHVVTECQVRTMCVACAWYTSMSNPDDIASQ
jgi:hypothetical protein